MAKMLKAFFLAWMLVCAAGAHAALIGRDLGGTPAFDAYYDTELDITWLADANYAKTSGFAPDGWMPFAQATSWVAGLDIYGVTGWRLPTVAPVNGTSFQYGYSEDGTTDFGFAPTGVGWGKASELGHMFYVTLGNTAYLGGFECTPPCALTNTGPFVNLQSHGYWSGTPCGQPDCVWMLETWNGRQVGFFGLSQGGLHAWAVHPGDVAAVPEPPAVALMALGVLALALRRRNTSAPAEPLRQRSAP